jgi:hypothetical protein
VIQHGPLAKRQALPGLGQQHVEQAQDLLNVIQQDRALANWIRRRQVEWIDAVRRRSRHAQELTAHCVAQLAVLVLPIDNDDIGVVGHQEVAASAPS